MWENQQGMQNYVCKELKMAPTVSTGVVLGDMMYLVSRLPELGKKGALIG